MVNITQSLLANSYSAFSPLVNVATVVCRGGYGQNVPCMAAPEFHPFVFLIAIIFALIISVPMIVGMWKVFKKAGHPGWASIVPVYNNIVMLQIIKKPLWWIFFFFIPLVSIFMFIFVAYQMAKAFGKGGWFTVGMIFLPFIFYPILGFGKAVYTPPVETAPQM